MLYLIVYQLYQVEEGKHKYPNQVYKVPIQSYFFHHFIMSSTLIGAQNNIKKYNDIDNDSREYVETVKTGNKEKEVGK